MDKLVQLLKEYLDLRLAAAQLSAQREVVRGLTLLIWGFVLVFCVGLVVVLLSLGLAWWLAERQMWGLWGYAAVAAFYALLALLVYFRRMALQRRVEQTIRTAWSPQPPTGHDAPHPHTRRTTGTDSQPIGR